MSASIFLSTDSDELRAFADETARVRGIAEGFIREVSAKIAADRNLEFDGMKQAALNAIEIYEKKIAGAAQTNVDSTLDEVLSRARALVDEGQSGLACATLRRAAEAMHHDEESRERYVEGVKLLYQRERDIALAAFDGTAAAKAVLALAKSMHGTDRVQVRSLLIDQARELYLYGRDQRSDVHLSAMILLQQKILALASRMIQRGSAQNGRGLALALLGEREGGTAKLEEAVIAYRAALKWWTRKRFGLLWATTQNNLGNALRMLGERGAGTERLEEAVVAHRAVLEELTLEHSPGLRERTNDLLAGVLAELERRRQ